jgi:hypothetical protein
MNTSSWIGLAVMIVSESATLAGIAPFPTWNTPIAWTGFILFADGIVWSSRGYSWLRSARGEFVFLAFASIALWLVFEFFNQFIHNWHYVGLPSRLALRYAGYTWAFATISPAIFEAGDLIAVWRDRRARLARRSAVPSDDPHGPTSPARRLRLPHSPVWSAAAVVSGALLLAWPIVTPSPYLGVAVWLGFILLLAPINRWLGFDTLLVQGSPARVVNLLLGGFLCGFLWEFWNYWAHAKWHYTVPILEQWKIFEMPVLGYFGFPAFALECFTMYIFVRGVAGRLWPRQTAHWSYAIALPRVVLGDRARVQ